MNLSGRLFSLAVSPKTRLSAFLSGAVVITLVAIYAHNAAALTLPVPWGDEGLFLWQARAFQRAYTFVAPELDPTRPILLLPFVYQAFLGIVFKVFGASLEVARHLSLGFVLCGFGLLAVLVRRRPAPALALLLVGAVVLNSRFVVLANVGRMEALVFGVICGALLLLDRERVWMALAVLSVSPMIHPNGVFYLGPAVIYALAAGGLRRTRPGRAVIAVFVLSGLVWLAHGLYVLRYWDGFVHDSALRFGEMAAGTAKAGLDRLRLGGWPWIELGLIAATAVIGVWRRAGIGHFLILALGAWIHSHIRVEQWYEPFGDLVYLLLSLAWLRFAAGVVASPKSPVMRRLQPLAPGVLSVILLTLLYRSGRIEGPIGYLRDLQASGMYVDQTGAYFRDEDRRALQNFFNTVEPGHPITVEVYPWPDAFLIANWKDERIGFLVPYFDPLFYPKEQWSGGYGPTAGAVPDLYIVHASRYTPPSLRYRAGAMIARARKHSEVGAPTIVHSRDSTEFWYALRTARKRNRRAHRSSAIRSAIRAAFAISVNVGFLAGRNGKVEPSARNRLGNSRLRPPGVVDHRPPSRPIGRTPA